MKKLHFTLILFIAVLLVISCHKRPELKIYKLEVSEETVNATSNDVTITASYSYPGEIPQIKVLVSTNESMTNAIETDAVLNENTLTAVIGDLSADTKYYYRYRYSNGMKLVDTDIKDFTTGHAIIVPTLTTATITSITHNSAVSGGNISNDGGFEVVARGVCWSTESEPTVADTHTEDGTGTGSFISTLTGLDGYTVYYVRAYATNSEGTGYGNEHMFVTEKSAPIVTTADITDINVYTAVCGGEVVKDCGFEVTARGVCWSTDENPTLDDSHTSDGGGLGVFTSVITGLVDNTTYYVRAYATNELGISYGEQKMFTAGNTPPVVLTNNVNAVTINSAQCSYKVTSEGGAAVTARGVCWNTTGDPTTNNDHTNDGEGTGFFTSNITGLASNTTYYVKAYATNEVGTSYGEQLSFTTLNDEPPTVITNYVTQITTNSVVANGKITANAGVVITERGICWDTHTHPTVNGNHIANGEGTGSYSCALTDLTPYTTYYVRAYALGDFGKSYGETVCFNTMAFEPPAGAISGVFSVSQTQQVVFSQGNLMYQASTNTWRFPANQYSYIGTGNQYPSATSADYIDLFGWGTSGYSHGAVAYQPYSVSQNDAYYYAYGNATYNLNDNTGKADWGYNAIQNGGGAENIWRTLTKDEWLHVLYARTTASGNKFAKAQVNSVNGLILLPDNWDATIYILYKCDVKTASYDSNVISAADWNKYFQANGAVFLPAAGSRDGDYYVFNVGTYGNYWSATYKDNDNSFFIMFINDNFGYSSFNRHQGYSVRLVQNIDLK
jgi:hypothetical protein